MTKAKVMPHSVGLRRSKLLRLVNATGRLFNNGSSLVRLQKQGLLDKACERTGLHDFGDDAFREALGVLLESFAADAELNFIGRICVQADLQRMLCNRLQLVEDRKRHPEIAAEVVAPPLFITGLPRSGTTFLHALLAQDPAHRSPRVWEVMFPSPPPEQATYDSDPRILKVEKQLKFIDVLMPDFKSVHLIDARLPQECIAITNHEFKSYTFESMYAVHSYKAWHDRLDKRPVYEYHRRFLQHLQWRCPGKCWVLKAPSHLLTLEALFQVYPDARIVLTHRDPLKVLASCASFTEVLRGAFTDHIDKESLGQEVRQRWESGAQLAVDWRRDQTDRRFLDVYYLDLVRDPMGMVRRIYDYFGMELTPEAEQAMNKFMQDNPKGKGGVHRYSLKEFGMIPEEERRRFQFYTDFFGIEPEKL
jgi:hypothetical protein